MSQQGGWGGPPQGNQGGFPQQGGGYPQQGGGYPQQGGYGPQGGGYQPQQPQGGFGQQSYPPLQGGMGAPPGGFQPTGGPPAKGGSSMKIIGIVVGALVVLGLVAALISVFFKPKDPVDPGGPSTGPTITVQTPTPTVTRPTTAPPSPTPTTTRPTASASTGTTTGPAGQAVVVGQGISVTPQAGWTVVKQEADFVVLSKGNAVFLAETGTVKAGTTGAQLVDSYLASQAKEMTNVKKNATTTVDVDPSLSIGKGLQVGTMTGSSGSQTLAFGALGSVRTADGVAFVGTLAWPASEDVAAYNADYTKMVSSMISTQLKK